MYSIILLYIITIILYYYTNIILYIIYHILIIYISGVIQRFPTCGREENPSQDLTDLTSCDSMNNIAVVYPKAWAVLSTIQTGLHRVHSQCSVPQSNVQLQVQLALQTYLLHGAVHHSLLVWSLDSSYGAVKPNCYQICIMTQMCTRMTKIIFLISKKQVFLGWCRSRSNMVVHGRIWSFTRGSRCFMLFHAAPPS